MKVKKSIRSSVKIAVADCRWTITEAVISLLKQMGAEPCQDVILDKPVIITKTDQKEMNGVSFNAHHIILDRLYYGPREDNVFLASYGDASIQSSTFMPVDALLKIYEAVYETVRKH